MSDDSVPLNSERLFSSYSASKEAPVVNLEPVEPVPYWLASLDASITSGWCVNPK